MGETCTVGTNDTPPAIQSLTKLETHLPEKMAPAIRLLDTLELLDAGGSSHTSPTFARSSVAPDGRYGSSFDLLSSNPTSGPSSSSGLLNASQWYNSIEPEVAKVAAKLPRKVALPAEYSLDESTEQNCMQQKQQQLLNGSSTSDFPRRFGSVRRSLDYSYHCHYTRERQLVQDGILLRLYGDSILSHGIGTCTGAAINQQEDQWIIFTAGPMGAGKSYTLQQLSETKRLSLDNFVLVDLDAIRRELPEYQYYASNNPSTAGDRTRKEAGCLTEIVTLAALQAGRSVVVDGSLRAYRWYRQYFARLRAEFPSLKIAIFSISAPRQSILHNAADRALETGRFVPLETLERVMKEVPQSMEILAPLADYFVTFVNNPAVRGVGGGLDVLGNDWKSFEQIWGRRSNAEGDS